jgi:hypothetical protein
MIVRLDSLDDFLHELVTDAADKHVLNGIVRVQADVEKVHECEDKIWFRAAYLRGPDELVEMLVPVGLDYNGKHDASEAAEAACGKVKQVCDGESLSCRRGRIEL